ncbi:MAG: hypothetical protein NC453_31070 [Muribaculum sp.]|nr:hypothetical protein [Muribaculum sp.]
MEYLIEIYKTKLTSIKRGNFRGIVSNAKPIFLISLIEAIPYINDNTFGVDNHILKSFYKENKPLFREATITPFIAPYFHMGSEPFYSLIWKCNTIPPSNSQTPSAKFLRENLQYAKLDDDLWDLLQDADNREYLKQAIINQYLKD